MCPSLPRSATFFFMAGAASWPASNCKTPPLKNPAYATVPMSLKMSCIDQLVYYTAKQYSFHFQSHVTIATKTLFRAWMKRDSIALLSIGQPKEDMTKLFSNRYLL